MREYLVGFDTETIERRFYDVVIVGSGIAGLTAAIKASRLYRTALLTKGSLKETSTWYAQGGIATAIGENDSPLLHLNDTLEAGAGLCNKEAAEILVSEGPDRIAELVAMGADFDKISGAVTLTREGGHSLPRILHAGDATGSAIEQALLDQLKTAENLDVLTEVFVLDVLTAKDRCVGVLMFDSAIMRSVAILSKVTILATGGIGQLYRMTTNPKIATGDGIAMAFRAGAEIMDMEFLQFHPTALDDLKSPRSLITEALRGEGAYLRDCRGSRFMVGKHPLAELAPRDIVVRAMVEAMNACGEDHIYLDATHIPKEQLRKRFPNIFERCMESGYDLSQDLTPVSPAAHYMVGGVKASMAGKTSIPGLFVSGEIAATGVHGANRLASNSLLEGLVMSSHIIQELPEAVKEGEGGLEQEHIVSRKRQSCSGIDVKAKRSALQQLMTDHAGIVRTEAGLDQAMMQVGILQRLLDCEMHDVDGFELQNMVTVARLIIEAARLRTESRGVHFREDHPQTDAGWLRHIVIRRTAQGLQIDYVGLSG